MSRVPLKGLGGVTGASAKLPPMRTPGNNCPVAKAVLWQCGVARERPFPGCVGGIRPATPKRDTRLYRSVSGRDCVIEKRWVCGKSGM